MRNLLKPLMRLQDNGDNLKDPDTVGVSHSSNRFQEVFSSTTTERLDEICSAERSASRSKKQREPKRRALIRSESWTGRLEPEVLAIIELAAEHYGGQGVADGMHFLAKAFAKKKEFTKEKVSGRVNLRAEKRTKNQEKWAKRRKKDQQ